MQRDIRPVRTKGERKGLWGKKAIVQVIEKVHDENLESMIALRDSCMQSLGFEIIGGVLG